MLSLLSWALHLSTLLVLPFSLFYFFLSYLFYLISAFHVARVVKNPPANIGGRRRGFLGGEDALEEGMATHSSILAWKNPMDREAWQATVHEVVKSQTGLK